jgi:hypothetical protein
MYTVGGERHGISFFPAVKLQDVEYVPGDSLGFNKYHSAEVIYYWLRKYTELYPELAEMYEVGKSFEGRPIWQVTITNKKTGRDTDKPGAFFEGGRHSGEVSGCETVMWILKYLLENYGKNPDVTALLDARSVYLRPVNNPDGHNLYIHSAQSNRSTVRPFDSDGDGLLDEDAPDDLNGDGVITQMRWKDTEKGNYISDSTDKSARAMKRVATGKGTWSVTQEGIDNDGDGRINEDGIGGLDLHRNYPENWRPETEYTGRGYTQGGAGDYPLSETETRSVVAFLLSHPNIYVVNSMDTSVPMHLRPPSTSPSEERMYPEDLKWYRYFDDLGRKITGYEKAGDVYNDYGRGNPLFGHGPDFGYWYYGSVWYGDEIWNGGRNIDYNKDGTVDQSEMLKWDDEENDSIGFRNWQHSKHPKYGDVEIGGFDPKFFSQNPPAKHMRQWISRQALFDIEMAKHLPLLKWENIAVRKSKAWKSDSADYEVVVSYRNDGKLPTALSQAWLVKIVREDRVTLTFDKKEGQKPEFIFIDEKKPSQDRAGRGMDGEQGSPGSTWSTSRNVPFTKGGDLSKVSFKIRTYGPAVLTGKAEVVSTRGGVLSARVFEIR